MIIGIVLLVLLLVNSVLFKPQLIQTQPSSTYSTIAVIQRTNYRLEMRSFLDGTNKENSFL